MFYSTQILSKDSPLGVVWIASHTGKLTKKQYAVTDISNSVDNIVKPDAPLALRLSGQLLLGVVLIYKRKMEFLMSDCSDALSKITQAFRAQAVDLPADAAHASQDAITLPPDVLGALDLSCLGSVLPATMLADDPGPCASFALPTPSRSAGAGPSGSQGLFLAGGVSDLTRSAGGTPSHVEDPYMEERFAAVPNDDIDMLLEEAPETLRRAAEPELLRRMADADGATSFDAAATPAKPTASGSMALEDDVPMGGDGLAPAPDTDMLDAETLPPAPDDMLLPVPEIDLDAGVLPTPQLPEAAEAATPASPQLPDAAGASPVELRARALATHARTRPKRKMTVDSRRGAPRTLREPDAVRALLIDRTPLLRPRKVPRGQRAASEQLPRGFLLLENLSELPTADLLSAAGPPREGATALVAALSAARPALEGDVVVVEEVGTSRNARGLRDSVASAAALEEDPFACTPGAPGPSPGSPLGADDGEAHTPSRARGDDADAYAAAEADAYDVAPPDGDADVAPADADVAPADADAGVAPPEADGLHAPGTPGTPASVAAHFREVDAEALAEEDALEGADGQTTEGGFTARTRLVMARLAGELQGGGTPRRGSRSKRVSVDPKTAGPRSSVPSSALLSGRSRADAARSFFELLVLRNKGYVQLEQKSAYDEIDIKPEPKFFEAAA